MVDMEDEKIMELYYQYIVLNDPLKHIGAENGIPVADLISVFKDNGLFFKSQIWRQVPNYVEFSMRDGSIRKLYFGWGGNIRGCDIGKDIIYFINSKPSLMECRLGLIDIVKHYNNEYLKKYKKVEWKKNKSIF